MLTNDSAYWKPTGRVDVAYHAYRLHEGRELNGTLAWGPTAGAGTTRGREATLAITGRHMAHWHDYSEVAATAFGHLRFLVVDTAR